MMVDLDGIPAAQVAEWDRELDAWRDMIAVRIEKECSFHVKPKFQVETRAHKAHELRKVLTYPRFMFERVASDEVRAYFGDTGVAASAPWTVHRWTRDEWLETRVAEWRAMEEHAAIAAEEYERQIAEEGDETMTETTEIDALRAELAAVRAELAEARATIANMQADAPKVAPKTRKAPKVAADAFTVAALNAIADAHRITPKMVDRIASKFAETGDVAAACKHGVGTVTGARAEAIMTAIAPVPAGVAYYDEEPF